MRATLGLLSLLSCLALLCVSGCARQEKPQVRTPEQVRAEIQKVENDPKMPANVKSMVLGLLRQELANAERVAKEGR